MMLLKYAEKPAGDHVDSAYAETSTSFLRGPPPYMEPPVRFHWLNPQLQGVLIDYDISILRSCVVF